MLTLILLACTGDSAAPPPPPPSSRVEAVAAAPKKEVATGEFCEANPGSTFEWPELDSAAPANAESWTWVNVWATWCKPCVAEMPMLAKWQKRLEDAGTKVALRFLSVDAGATEVANFYKAHPEVPQGVRLKNISLLPGWLPKVGLDANAVLPVHLFVDPQQKVRCVRMGSLGEEDYDVVKKVVSGS